MSAELLQIAQTVAKAAGGGYRRGIFMQEDVLGEGGIVSTVDDMLAWTAHLRRAVGGQPQLGNADTWQQMVTPACLNNGQPTPYALGLMVTEHRGAATLQHAGGVVGGACQMVTVPEYGLDLILMTNGPAAMRTPSTSRSPAPAAPCRWIRASWSSTR